MPVSTDKNARIHYTSQQESAKPDNISDTLFDLHKISSRRMHTEHEEEQFRQALNIRQGGIRKYKNESKVKAKNQVPTKLHKYEPGVMLSDMRTIEKIDEPRRSDFSEPENEHFFSGSSTVDSLKFKKLQKSFARNSQNLEPRDIMQAVEPLLVGKLENKIPNHAIRNTKEIGNTSMPEFRRSRSTPRGKFFNLP